MTAESLKKFIVGKSLRIGSVIHKFCDFTTPPKNKFLVVVSLKPRLLVLIINSEINKFYFSRGLDKFSVPIPEAEHDFLKHDSYALCVQAFDAFDLSEIRNDIMSDYNQYMRGFLTDECLSDVYCAVRDNTLIKQGFQKEIITSIDEFFDEK